MAKPWSAKRRKEAAARMKRRIDPKTGKLLSAETIKRRKAAKKSAKKRAAGGKKKPRPAAKKVKAKKKPAKKRKSAVSGKPKPRKKAKAKKPKLVTYCRRAKYSAKPKPKTKTQKAAAKRRAAKKKSEGQQLKLFGNPSRKRGPNGQYMRGNPSPVDVGILNPDVMAMAKDAGAAGLGLALGMITGPVVNAMWQRYGAGYIREGEPLLPMDIGTALVASGVPLAGGLLVRRYVSPRIGEGMMYGSAALLVAWIVKKALAKMATAEVPGAVSAYVNELELGPLGNVDPALLVSTATAGRAMLQNGPYDMYSVAPTTEAPIWELEFDDGSAVEAEYLGDIETEQGPAFQLREMQTGQTILLPIELEADHAGNTRAYPLQGVVSDSSRLGGIVRDSSRLGGIVRDTDQPRTEDLSGIVSDDSRLGMAEDGSGYGM